MVKGNILNEKSVLKRLSNGDSASFRLIFDFYKDVVYSTALKFTKSPSLSEEITQDVFLRVWQRRSQLVEVENLGGYLRVIARNRTFKEMKKLAAESELYESLPAESGVNPVEENILLKDTMKIIEKAVRKLPPRQRMVYELCHFEGLKYHEAAAKLNISVLTVKTHMQHALFSLRKYVAGNLHLWILPFLLLKFLKS